MTIYQINHFGNTQNVCVKIDKYSINESLALCLDDAESGEPYAVVSSYVRGMQAMLSHEDFIQSIAVKTYSENEGLLEEMIRLEILEPTAIGVINNGYMNYPIHRLTQKFQNDNTITTSK